MEASGEWLEGAISIPPHLGLSQSVIVFTVLEKSYRPFRLKSPSSG
jgi:hypothetical protein